MDCRRMSVIVILASHSVLPAQNQLFSYARRTQSVSFLASDLDKGYSFNGGI